MLRSLLSGVLGGRRGGMSTTRAPRTTRGAAGGSSTDAAIGRGVRGLLGRFGRR